MSEALANVEKKGDAYKGKRTQRKSFVNKRRIAASKAKVAAKKLALKHNKAAKKVAVAAHGFESHSETFFQNYVTSFRFFTRLYICHH